MENTQEQWKTIVGYPAYEVSNYGRVKRVTRAQGTATGVLKTFDNGHGYRQLRLCVGGVPCNHKVHRLVCRAFHGEPPTPEHTYVNHRDCDPSNNRVDNLEWCTPSENVQHAHDNGRHPRQAPPAPTKVGRYQDLSELQTVPPVGADDVEEWYIVGECPAYSVSSLGQVKRMSGGRGTQRALLKTSAIASGYRKVSLSIGNRVKQRLVHRLVCSACHTPPTAKHTVVNHINGDKADNRACNLEWVTYAENNRHARASQPSQFKKPRDKVSDSMIEEIVRRLSAGETRKQVGADLGIAPQHAGRLYRQYRPTSM